MNCSDTLIKFCAISDKSREKYSNCLVQNKAALEEYINKNFELETNKKLTSINFEKVQTQLNTLYENMNCM